MQISFDSTLQCTKKEKINHSFNQNLAELAAGGVL